MSTPDEQQQQQQSQQQPPHDPYGTQTWQADTWDTGYQPVHPPLGAVPGQPVAPEGWFRDEAPAAPGTGAVPGQAEAYPSYQGLGQGQVPAEGQAAWGASGTGQEPQALAPEGWFRDEAPAAPVQDWSQGGGPGAGAPAAAAETAYLPPYPGPGQQQGAAAEQTAYLPPYPGPEQQQGAAAEQTAYLPPYPGPEQQQAVAPEGWFREEAPAAPVQDWSQGGQGVAGSAGLPPFPGPELQQELQVSAAEQTAFLPPQAAADPAPAAVPAPAGSAAGAAEATDWSPPTLAGNTVRAVDPAQARAEGRSPIIDPGPQPAILTAALGLLLAGAAALGQYALLVPLVALQGLTAAGWFRLNGMWPARQGIALAFAGALAADAAVLAVEEAYGAGAIVGTLGAWVLLTLVLQLRSQADPDERMYGLMASVASAALAIICTGYLAADTAAVTVGAAAVAVAVFVRALPLPTATSVGVSLASAAGAGVAVGGITSVGVGGALLGLVAGVCALVGLRVAAYDYPSKFVHMTAGVALPLAAAAPAVYLIGRVVG
ncbi:hypothetical protein [Streptomyces erythrochromogenes]|uniref:hypothetical protein n=1 Tax=Streptomyces erythrochromogenes TaxID=285574 RepID=UPI003817AB10